MSSLRIKRFWARWILFVLAACPALAEGPATATSRAATADELAAVAWGHYRAGNDGAALEAAHRTLTADGAHYKANELAGGLLHDLEDYSGAFACWVKLLSVERPETIHYLRRVNGLPLDDAQRAAFTRILETLAGDKNRPLTATLATSLLADAVLDTGKVEQARTLYERLGLIRDWLVIGPFNNERNGGFNQSLEPETTIDLAAEYDGRNHKVRWRELKQYDFTTVADLSDTLHPNTNALAYLATYVNAQADVQAVLRFAGEKAVKVWVNDRLVFTDDQPHGFKLDRHEVPTGLRKGANKVLAKICTDEGKWRFALRITDPTGRPIDGLVCSTVPQETPKCAAEPRPEFVFAQSMVGHFAAAVAARPDNQDDLYYLALAAADCGDDQLAARTLEHLIEINPRPVDYNLYLANAYWSDQKPEKALIQMKAALDAHPNNVQVLATMGRFYTSRGLLEKAREILRQALELRPDSLILHDHLRRVFVAEGWDEQAYRTAARNYQAAGQVPWVIAEYARMAERRGYLQDADDLSRQVLQRDYDNYGIRNALAIRCRAQGRTDLADEEFDRLQTVFPLRNDLRLQRVHMLAQDRKFDLAVRRCREALEVCGTNPTVYRELGDVYERMGRMEDALAAWNKALEYNPDDQRLREYVDFLKPKENAVFAEYGVSEEQAATIRKQRAKPEEFPRAGAVILLDHLVTQLFDDGSSTSLEHSIVQILNEQGRSGYTEVPLSSRNAIVRRAVTISPDGTETEATKVSEGQIHFDKIQPGSLIEYKVVHYQSPSSWLSRHYTGRFLFQNPAPIRRSEWVLVYPTDKPLRYHLQGRDVKVEKGTFQGQTVLHFLAQDCPQIESETNRPPLMDIVNHVRASTVGSWDEIARWEYALIKDEFMADAKLKRQVAELIRGRTTRDDKTRKLATFVAQEIQYKILHGGIFGIKPHKAANVLENQWGDCKDKATLLITMLRDVGIPAYYATLLTRSAGTFLPELPDNQCDHAIVYVPDEGDFRKGRWIDATAEHQSVDILPWQDQGVRAMVFDDKGNIVFLDTPAETADRNLRTSSLTADLEPDGQAKVANEWEIRGQEAAVFRQMFFQEGKRAEILTSYINSLSPGSRLVDFNFDDLKNREIPVRVRMNFVTERFGQRQGDKLIVLPKHMFQMTARFAARDIRYYDVFLQYCRTISYRETYRMPKGYKPASLPPSVNMETLGMRYRFTCSPADGAVTVEKTLTIDVTSIPKSGYDDLRRFCYEVDQHEQKTLEFVPVSP